MTYPLLELSFASDWPDPDVEGFSRAAEKLGRAVRGAVIASSHLGPALQPMIRQMAAVERQAQEVNARTTVELERFHQWRDPREWVRQERAESLRRETVSWFMGASR